ncbi:hypothetical protein Tco_1031357 [Tanacetum coccineum]|uniref:Uncharacterized protein n=1 Tax=Tanacetum coccineum TaxID=301880 RepID=A0ABQ5GA40_9ASTR
MGVYQRTSTHSSITYTDDKGIWGIHEEDSGKEHAMVSRLGKLWFKISIEDTMRLIKEDQFRETIQEEWCSRECRSMDEEQSLFLGGEQVTNVDDDVDDSPENDLALNVDHVFEADECDAFDSDVDEGPTTQTMFMANLTSEDSIYDEAGPSYDSNNPCEVQDHDTFVDRMNEYHEVHEMQNDDNEEHVVQCNVSSVRNDTLMTILDEMHEQGVQRLISNSQEVELEKVKQHYKELYDSIKITHAHTSEKTSTMLNEIESLKAQLRSKESCFTSDQVKPKVLAPSMYAINVKPIPHPLKNNRSAHLNYISHLKESVEIVREIVEEARVDKPLDNALNYACQYTKLS